MNTDNNTISNDFSSQLACLFKLLEKNKVLFIDYCKILQADGKIYISEPEDEKIANNRKLLADYCNEEAIVQACPILIQKVLEVNNVTGTFLDLQKADYTKVKLAVENKYGKYWSFTVPLEQDVFDKLLENLEKDHLCFEVMGVELYSLPRDLIFETFVPYFCRSFAFDEKTQENNPAFENPDQTLNLTNYIVGRG